ncbi:MAG: hypothetical protein HYY02_13525 [Chloroflexi bacterium]|nr:hypothetical protein [Chloroflexota bacterium]
MVSSAQPNGYQYKVAAIQYDATMFHKEENIRDLLALTEEAARAGARLIVTPEMATVGYCWYNRQEIAPYVEPIPGPTTDAFAAIASRHGCYIVVGMAEVDPATDIYYNAIALVGPSGVVGKYRKTHCIPAEAKWAAEGNLPLPVWQTEIGNIGGLICMDALVMETCRVLALEGADLICVPFASVSRGSFRSITRAFENGVYMVTSNRIGLERGTQYAGGTCISNPDGTLQALLDDGNGVVYGEVDLAEARKKEFWGETADNKMRDRLPGRYKTIHQHVGIHNPLRFHGLFGYRALPPGRKSTVAVAQVAPTPGDVAANLKKLEELITSPRADRADLIVFPELCTTGAVFRSREEARSVAEPLAGPTVMALMGLARERNKHLVVGLVEQEGDTLFNTAVLIAPQGLAGKYRKAHLNSRDKVWATPGDDGFPTFDVAVGRIGILLGYDLMFPEAARCLAIEGADLLCAPSAVEGPAAVGFGPTAVPVRFTMFPGYDPLSWYLWRARAQDNNTYLAFANQIGEQRGVRFAGGSGIFGPGAWDGGAANQEVIARPDVEAVSLLEMDTTNADANHPTNPVRAKEALRSRRTIWYDVISAKHPPVLDVIAST